MTVEPSTGAASVRVRRTAAVAAPAGVVERVFGARSAAAGVFHALLASDGVEHGLLGPREADRLWSRHLLPGAALSTLVPRESSVVDVGSGSGLPGLALALARPDLTVTLVEPMARRCEFLTRAVDVTGSSGRVQVVRARAEELAGGTGFDVVTARALAPLPRLLELLLPACRPGGQVLAVKGAGLDREVVEAARALERSSIRRWETVELAPPVWGADRPGDETPDTDTIRVFRLTTRAARAQTVPTGRVDRRRPSRSGLRRRG